MHRICLTAAGVAIASSVLCRVASPAALANASKGVVTSHHIETPQLLKGGVTPDTPPIHVPPIGTEQAKKLSLGYLLAQQTTNFNHASASQAKNIALVARRLNGTVVKPNGVFSYYATVGPYTAENGYHWGRAFSGDRIIPSMGGGVCQGASTLYSALLRTGLPVIERHAHSLKVPYLPPGEDTTVASTYLNFRFRNNRSTPILITAKADVTKRLITVELWGATPAPEITVHHKILAIYPYRTIYQHDSSLHGEETRVLAPGQDGIKGQTWLQIKTEDGVKTKDLGIDTYKPSPRIIVVDRDLD